MTIGYIWGIIGDENVPMPVDADDLLKHPHLVIDLTEFEDDMNQSTSSSVEDKPF